MNIMMQRSSARSCRVSFIFRSALAAILLSSGVAMGVIALSAQGLNSAFLTSWQRITVPSSSPGKRDYAAIAYDEARHEVVVFGGIIYDQSGNSVRTNDTWTWDSRSWTLQHPTTPPPTRAFTQMAYVSSIGKVVLFGGQHVDQGVDPGSITVTDLNDTWAWDGTNWTQLSPTNSPPGRESHSLAYDKEHQQLVIFGGNSFNSGTDFADTWVFDGATWTQVEPATSPRPLSYASMIYDPVNRGLLLYGGYLPYDPNQPGAQNQTNETWFWDGSRWTQFSPVTSPPRAITNSLAYDDATSRAVLYLYGDYADLFQQKDGETWEWDGQDWAKSTAASPPRRQGAMVVYHPDVNRILMYGGFYCGLLDDEWLWDGNSWTQIGSPVPPGRSYAAMAFDTTRNESVLFGGSRCGASDARDTWTWNGSKWTEVRVTDPPSSRSWASMAYDPERKVTVLFGGRTFSGRVNETWIFDGASWTQQFPATSPPIREGAAMAFDAEVAKSSFSEA